MADGVRVLLRVDPEPGTDPETADQLGRRLRAYLRELDVESVSSAPGVSAPAGAKGADPVTLAAVVVAVSASGGVLTGVLDGVREWLARQSAARRITVTLDGDTLVLERVTAGEREQLVETFVRRHTDG
jgi:hypothetical protein